MIKQKRPVHEIMAENILKHAKTFLTATASIKDSFYVSLRALEKMELLCGLLVKRTPIDARTRLQESLLKGLASLEQLKETLKRENSDLDWDIVYSLVKRPIEELLKRLDHGRGALKALKLFEDSDEAAFAQAVSEGWPPAG